MIYHVLSFILGGFIVFGVGFGAFWLLVAAESYEEKVKDTKPYKIASTITTVLLWAVCLAFSVFLCWALGDSILTSIGG